MSSNPTNLVLSGAFSFSFISYPSSLILPFLAAALVVYPFLILVLFRAPRDLIPRTIDTAPGAEGLSDPRTVLVDAAGAVFGGVQNYEILHEAVSSASSAASSQPAQ